MSLYPLGKAPSGAPLASATTAPSGAWSLSTSQVPGSYLLQIVPADANHATLHQSVSLVAGSDVVVAKQLTVLSSTEQQCITLFNQQRATLGVGALTTDNAAMIAARAEAQAIATWAPTDVWPNITAPPSVTPSSYMANGGISSASVTGDDYDSGANGCAMVMSNIFGSSDEWYPENSGANSTWIGFGVASDVVGGFPGYEWAAAVVTYP
ncbi:hypothetical protein EPN42_05180 [bacterium]|nr:MAG: hypothetical protein EPN42_05180 [bacterium]